MRLARAARTTTARTADRRLRRPRHGQVQRLRRARLLQARRAPAVRHRVRPHPRLCAASEGGRNFTVAHRRRHVAPADRRQWRSPTTTARSRTAPERRDRPAPKRVAPGLIGAPAAQRGFNSAGQHVLPAGLQQPVLGAPGHRALRLHGPRHEEFSPTPDAATSSWACSRVEDRPDASRTRSSQHHRPAADRRRPASVRVHHQLRAGRRGQPVQPRNAPLRPASLAATSARATTRSTSDTFRILAGLIYSVGTWDLDSARRLLEEQGRRRSTPNRLSQSGVSAAFGVPSAPQPPVPIVDAPAPTTSTDSTHQQRRGPRLDARQRPAQVGPRS